MSCPIDGLSVDEQNQPDDAGTVVFEGRPMKSWALHRRWDRAGRLLGEDAMERLYGSHVMVFGLGGVGSYTAESLARTGLGKLTLVDFDRVCGTNTNRQLHAMKGTFGKWKADLMAERCSLINPEATVVGRRAFYHEATSESFLSQRPDFVVDAIDNVSAKVHLLVSCMEQGIPVVSCMGAAGKVDPTRIEIADLARTKGDPLARAVRKIMRQRGVLSGNKRLGIPTVYSSESRHEPQSLSYDGTSGFRCICPTKGNDLHSCEHRNLIEGTVSFVTGSFGMMAASVVVRELTSALSAQAAAE
ncbi:tRNA threonylcarbamoyladenosine dehydratase [Lujinxingia vulgaris]|nr:tRNA threonylcarbamoyladenosine dehydratase [Lujinxingia vulgaris]